MPTTDHSQRILKKPLDARSKQETEYIRTFLLQFKPFQELSPAGLDAAVKSVTFHSLKAHSQGVSCRVLCAWTFAMCAAITPMFEFFVSMLVCFAV